MYKPFTMFKHPKLLKWVLNYWTHSHNTTQLQYQYDLVEILIYNEEMSDLLPKFKTSFGIMQNSAPYNSSLISFKIII